MTHLFAYVRKKQYLMPVYDKPMFEELLGDGSRLGMTLHYKVQLVPNGLAQAFVLGREFLNGETIGTLGTFDLLK